MMNPKPAGDARVRLNEPVQFLKGVGPQRAELLGRLGVKTLADLLFLFPRRYQDFSNIRAIPDLQEGQPASVVGTVDEVDTPESRSGRQVIYLLLRQDRHYLRAIWFNQPYLLPRLAIGQRLVLRGEPRRTLDRWEMVHPKITWLGPDSQPERGQILPIYPLTEGLQQPQMRRIIESAVEQYADLLPEVFPPDFLEPRQLAGIAEAVRNVHFPLDLAALDRARQRLVYQELLVLQLALALRRESVRRRSTAPELPLSPRLQSRIESRFRFQLTESQRSAVAEIAADMAEPHPMNRLLHGDVGSGKTAVALYAMLLAVAHGYQAVLMTPTEVLARQHYRTLREQLASSRVRLALYSSGLGAADKRGVQESIAAGDVDLVTGTSAVIYGDLHFQKLGLVVIDEQHKFGVRQRARLRQSGLDPHYLVMTATPIPRTMALTTFGDLDVSVLRREHASGVPLRTYLAEPARQAQWWSFFRRKLSAGRQGFVITPRVDEEEQQSGAEQAYEGLVHGELADFRVDLIHGRQSTEEQEAAMLAFVRGQTQVLVATSLVEVGIDVPNATVMTILAADRFGLSQLHQLRGRVGRGLHPGFVCLFADEASPAARQRLEAFVKTEDGFALAELDFQLRGPGELIGTRQHGLPPMRIADLRRDQGPLDSSRADARQLIAADPTLADPRWEGLRRMVLARYGRRLELSDVG